MQNTEPGQHLSVSQINKPAIWNSEAPMQHLTAEGNNKKTFAALKNGQKFCFKGTWGTAMAFYSWLKKQINNRYPIYNYQSSRTNREKLNAITQGLYLHIVNHRPELAKAPDNPWLNEFYPGNLSFHLRLTDFLGMNGARQWYQNGIQLPGLSHKIHPWYGTYFPTRTEHLELFDQWLEKNNDFQLALDMGTGCGALTFYMIKHGIQEVIATDINPNALYSVQQDLKRNPTQAGVQLFETSFFEGIANKKPDLVVFNPPWLPLETHTSIDKAMYYDSGFFDAFFSQAQNSLSASATIAILFSNFARVAGITPDNPIDIILRHSNQFELVQKLEKPITQNPSAGKDWLQKIRSQEKSELYILKRL